MKEQVIELRNQGFSNRKIAKKLNISHVGVASILKRNGLSSAWTHTPTQIIDDNEIKCSKCNKVLPLNQFLTGRKGQKNEYRFSYCLSCRRTQSYKNLNSSIEKFLAQRVNRLRRKSTKENIPFNLTSLALSEVYRAQNGKCFYTNESLAWKVGSGLLENCLSVDKIIPENGYVYDNIVLCTQRANSIKFNLSLDEMKMWMPDWYGKIKEFLYRRERLMFYLSGGRGDFIDNKTQNQIDILYNS